LFNFIFYQFLRNKSVRTFYRFIHFIIKYIKTHEIYEYLSNAFQTNFHFRIKLFTKLKLIKVLEDIFVLINYLLPLSVLIEKR